jgi:hypothetical protein
MAQDRDTLSAGLERMITLADQAWHASPEESARQLHAFRHVNKAFQSVVVAYQRAARLTADADAVHRSSHTTPPDRLEISDDDVPW